MDKIERLTYIFTRQIREKPTVEDFTREEYRELVRRIRDWCNECPGFDKDDCFKLSDRYRNKWMGDIALPSVEPRWIPVSEELPEDYQDVLVWFEYFRYGDYNCMYSTYGIGNYSNRYDSWLINHETGWTDLHVFAWMPLPEPPMIEGEQDEY